MHWQAIRSSTLSQRSRSFRAYDGACQHHDTHRVDEDVLHLQETGSSIPQGQDEALDITSDFNLPPTPATAMPIQPAGESDADRSTDDEHDFLQVPIPTFSTGLTTFAYQRALRNRVRNHKLERHGEYNIRKFTPTFVHDCLMLPGSLANVLGKVSSEQIIHRMTPALLPGFHAHIHSETQQPCLLQSSNCKDYFQGMVIFGQGKEGRNLIHRHYRPNARRVKVQVEIDVLIPAFPTDHTLPCYHWVFQRRKIWAHAWLWCNVSSVDVQFRSEQTGWTLEAYLAGDLAANQSLRIEPAGRLGEDYDADGVTDEDDNEAPQHHYRRKPKVEPREVVYGGPGHLDYERDAAAVGWW